MYPIGCVAKRTVKTVALLEQPMARPPCRSPASPSGANARSADREVDRREKGPVTAERPAGPWKSIHPEKAWKTRRLREVPAGRGCGDDHRNVASRRGAARALSPGRSLRPSWASLTRSRLRSAILAALAAYAGSRTRAAPRGCCGAIGGKWRRDLRLRDDRGNSASCSSIDRGCCYRRLLRYVTTSSSSVGASVFARPSGMLLCLSFVRSSMSATRIVFCSLPS